MSARATWSTRTTSRSPSASSSSCRRSGSGAAEPAALPPGGDRLEAGHRAVVDRLRLRRRVPDGGAAERAVLGAGAQQVEDRAALRELLVAQARPLHARQELARREADQALELHVVGGDVE